MFWDKLYKKRFKKIVFAKMKKYKEMTFDDLKFYYRNENVDYTVNGHQGPNRFKKYGFEHDHSITDSRMIFRNKAGKKALVIHVSVPTFDLGDREWDSYRKLFLIPEAGGMTGFMICGGYEVAKIIAYEDVRCADKKTESLLNEFTKYL